MGGGSAPDVLRWGVSTELAPGSVVAGRYRIVARLGEGGMGAVYRATQEPLGREVALKVMSAALAQDKDAIERFHREARASSSLSHPNIVTVYDFGEDRGALYLAMELIPGTPLDALLEQGPLPWPRALTILRGVCAALTEAHTKGIIHRDLKPANVIVSATSTHVDVAKVVDFGIAKLKETGNKSLTMTGAIVGTPGYVAPELFHGLEPSPQADLYALGVMAFDILCGGPPFKGNTAAELLKQHLFDPPPAPSSRAAGLPPALDALVLSLLEKDPSKRPASARDVDAALAALAGVVVVPLAPSQSTEMGMSKAKATAVTPGSSSLLSPPSRAFSPSPVSQSSSSPQLSPLSQLSPPRRWPLVVAGLVVLAASAGGVALLVSTSTPVASPPVVASVPAPAPSAPSAPSAPASPPVSPPVSEPVSPPAPASPRALSVVEDDDNAADQKGRKKKKREREQEQKEQREQREQKTEAVDAAAAPLVATSSAPRRRAFLGTVPDATFTGHGVRIGSVTRRSPAAAALVPGDIMIQLDNDVVDGVAGLAIALSRHAPGDRVRVVFVRDGAEHAVELTLTGPPGTALPDSEPERRRDNSIDGTLRRVGNQIDRQFKN